VKKFVSGVAAPDDRIRAAFCTGRLRRGAAKTMKSERWRQVDELFERALERAIARGRGVVGVSVLLFGALALQGVPLIVLPFNAALAAVYGFRVSLGGRSLFRGGLLED
jgi:hypothetical protein